MRRVHIIANPVAGGGRGRAMALLLESALRAHDFEASTFFTTRASDAHAEAGRTDAPIIAVVGGDGTLNEVLNGLPDSTSTTIAILPVGTANVVARELGMRSDPAFTVRAIVAGHTVAMDIGLQENRRFLLGAGAGLDAAVTKVVQEQRGHKSSLLKWAWPALNVVLRYDYPKIRVLVDGETLAEAADYVIIGNCKYSAGVFPATPHVDISDGKLDVCAMSGLSLPRMVWLLVNVWRPSFVNRSWIAYRQGKVISLHPANPDAPAWLQIDGDPAGAIPAVFAVAPWQLTMVVPEAVKR